MVNEDNGKGFLFLKYRVVFSKGQHQKTFTRCFRQWLPLCRTSRGTGVEVGGRSPSLSLFPIPGTSTGNVSRNLRPLHGESHGWLEERDGSRCIRNLINYVMVGLEFDLRSF